MSDSDGGVERPYSKDYWDNVIREIGRRPAVKISAVLLVLIYATAIYAPLIANDRPLVLEGIDYGAYKSARTTLAPIVSSVRDLAERGPDGHDEAQLDRLLATAVAAVRGRVSASVISGGSVMSGEQLEQVIEPWRDAVRASILSGDFSGLESVGEDVADAVEEIYPDVRTVRVTDEAEAQVELLEDEYRTWGEVVGLERDAFELRTATMGRFLTDELAQPLVELGGSVADLTDRIAALGATDDKAPLIAEADALVARTREVRSTLRAQKPDGSSTSGVPLHSSRSYPAFAAISNWEMYFMALWLLVMTWPLWNWAVNRAVLGSSPFRIRSARRPKVLAMLLIPAVVALAWDGGVNDLFSGYKRGLTDGTIVASTATFPPIPYGRAEQNATEVYRPPTWSADAAINEAGFYETGARVQRVGVTDGTEQVAIPVEIGYAESARNDLTRRLLGTDSLGRDLLSRMIWGGRISLSVGLVAAAFMVILGTIIGSVAGYFGGRIDMVVSRIIEVFQCFPVLFFALVIVAFLGPGILNIMIVLGLLRWTTTARLARGEFIRLRDQEFVVASEALGVSHTRTIFRHILPNALGPILVSFTFSVALGILVESSLSFLGFGIQLPIPSWGSLLQESSSPEHWWIQVFTGFAIFLTILLYNLLGEGLRDAFDPRQKAR